MALDWRRGLLLTRMRVYQIKMSDLTNKKAAVEDGEGDEGGSRYSAGDAVWYQSDKEIGWWPCLVSTILNTRPSS